MNAQFNARALDLAVIEYNVLKDTGDPVTPAAFGIACSHLQQRLNLSLLHAAEMLRLELDRLAAIKLQEEQTERAQYLRDNPLILPVERNDD